MPKLSTPRYQAHARNRTSARTPVRSVSRFALESKPSAQARTRGAPTVRRPDTTAPVSSLPPAAAPRNRDRNYLCDSLIQHRNQNILAVWGDVVQPSNHQRDEHVADRNSLFELRRSLGASNVQGFEIGDALLG